MAKDGRLVEGIALGPLLIGQVFLGITPQLTAMIIGLIVAYIVMSRGGYIAFISKRQFIHTHVLVHRTGDPPPPKIGAAS